MAEDELKYQPVAEWDDIEETDPEQGHRPPGRKWLNITGVKDLLLVLLCLAVMFLSIAQVSDTKCWATAGQGQDQSSSGSLLTPDLDEDLWVSSRSFTNYSYKTIDEMEAVNANWKAIKPYLGIVAVDQDWAKQRGLPLGDPLNSDPTKSVYTLESYHALHCLIIVRRGMFELARGQPLSLPFGHSMHCFDALLQTLTCNADETLLYTAKGKAAGDGQTRKCRSWDALRTWAATHYSCYFDGNEGGPAQETVVGCEDRKAMGDGIIVQDS